MNTQTLKEWRENHLGKTKRKRRIRRSIIWWERAGVVVSTIATLLAGGAVATSVWQASIMKDQLNVANRNTAFAEVLKRTDNYCSAISYEVVVAPSVRKALSAQLVAFETEELGLTREAAAKLLEGIRDYSVWAPLDQDAAVSELHHKIEYSALRLTGEDAAKRAEMKIAMSQLCRGLSTRLIEWFRHRQPLDIKFDYVNRG